MFDVLFVIVLFVCVAMLLTQMPDKKTDQTAADKFDPPGYWGPLP